MAHAYNRHDTPDLVAAMNVATGEILTNCAMAYRQIPRDVLRLIQ